MMTFERTTNVSLIRRIMTHPRLWENTTDDFAGDRESFEPRMDPDIWYVLVKASDEALLGMFILAPQNQVCWEIHVRMLPEYWGDPCTEALQGIVLWAWENTPARRLVSNIFAHNRLAIRYAERCGFEEFGRNPESAQKGGKLVDQVLVGVSK